MRRAHRSTDGATRSKRLRKSRDRDGSFCLPYLSFPDFQYVNSNAVFAEIEYKV